MFLDVLDITHLVKNIIFIVPCCFPSPYFLDQHDMVDMCFMFNLARTVINKMFDCLTQLLA